MFLEVPTFVAACFVGIVVAFVLSCLEAVMIFKGVYFFNLFQQGWTETLYVDQTDIGAAVSTLVQAVPPLLLTRHLDVAMPSLRVSKSVNGVGSRLSQLVPINQTGLRGNALLSPPPSAEDVVQTAALVRCKMADGSNESRLWRGMSDEDVVRDAATGVSTPSAGLLSAIGAASGILSNLAVGGITQVTPTSFVQVTGLSASVAPVGVTQVSGPNATGFKFGDQVRFKLVPKAKVPWLKGQWTVIAADTTSIYIGYPWQLSSALVPVGMQVYKVNQALRRFFLFPTIQAIEFADFRSRKTGRPTALTRGRSSGIRFRTLARAAG